MKGIMKLTSFIHHKKKGIEKPSSFKLIETNCETYAIKGLFLFYNVKHSIFTLSYPMLITAHPPVDLLPQMVEVMELWWEGEGEVVAAVVVHHLAGQQAQPEHRRVGFALLCSLGNCLRRSNSLLSVLIARKHFAIQKSRDNVPLTKVN